MNRQILLAGDSTVTNRENQEIVDSDCSHTGWGQMLPLFLGPNYKVKNFAKSGRTTESFREEGLFDELISNLNCGDYVLFQFGHNDEKIPELQANGKYKENLKRFITEIREQNGIPILVSPLGRNSWNCSTGEYNDLLVDYANATKKASIETNTQLIDLHEGSIKWFIENGREAAKPYFRPGDFTHTNDYGAFKVANFIYKELKNIIESMEIKDGWTDYCPTNIHKIKFNNINKAITRLEAYQIVVDFFGYFAINENDIGCSYKETLAAKQNGFLIFEDDLETEITEMEFVELLCLAMSGRENVPIDLFDTENIKNIRITYKEVLNYLEIIDKKLGYKELDKVVKVKGC